MGIEEIENMVKKRYSNRWNVYIEEFGVCIWIAINDASRNFFDIQITPNDGIGVTYRNELPKDLDLSGHDEVFGVLGEALDYVDKIIAKNQ